MLSSETILTPPLQKPQEFTSHIQNTWFNSLESLQMHQENWQARMSTLKALQIASRTLLNAHLDEPSTNQALEVACGIGFFKTLLAPDWLKPKILGFDISLPALKASPDQENLFQSDATSPPIKKNSMDAVIGLSAFDSIPNLYQALDQSASCLKLGKPLILLQDALADLYSFSFDRLDSRSVGLYHQTLALMIKTIPTLQIIEEKQSCLESVAKESLKNILIATGTSELLDINPLIIASNFGEKYIYEKPENPDDVDTTLQQFNQEFKTSCDLTKFNLKENEVIQWLRLHYLVAIKI